MSMEQTERLGARQRVDWSRFVTGALVAALAGVLVYQGIGEARRTPLVKAGEPAPPVVGKTLQGASFDLEALRGKTVLLDFWTTWCGPCKKEMPTLVSLAREYRDRGLVLVAADHISQEFEGPAAVGVAAEQLAPDRPDNIQVVLTADETLNAYRVQSYPTTYLISRDGRVVQSFRGLTSESTLRGAIERALQP